MEQQQENQNNFYQLQAEQPQQQLLQPNSELVVEQQNFDKVNTVMSKQFNNKSAIQFKQNNSKMFISEPSLIYNGILPNTIKALPSKHLKEKMQKLCDQLKDQAQLISPIVNKKCYIERPYSAVSYHSGSKIPIFSKPQSAKKPTIKQVDQSHLQMQFEDKYYYMNDNYMKVEQIVNPISQQCMEKYQLKYDEESIQKRRDLIKLNQLMHKSIKMSKVFENYKIYQDRQTKIQNSINNKMSDIQLKKVAKVQKPILESVNIMEMADRAVSYNERYKARMHEFHMRKYGNNWFQIRNCIPDTGIHNISRSAAFSHL